MPPMSDVRLLVGTKEAAFILRSDASRKDWSVEGPHFAGMEVHHLQGSPAELDRIYAAQWTDWHGQLV